MNPNILKLFEVANKPERIIIGLMSGTSMDGLDVALCRLKGTGMSTEIKLENFTTVPYNDDYKKEVKSVFSKRDVDLEKVCLLNAWIALQQAQMVLGCIQQWGLQKDSIDLIASHGQTIYHAPKSLHGVEKFPNATLQIGDGDHFAVTTGIITISDFRQKHIAAGGEGAPLAVYGDYLIFSKAGENRIMLNIGGIANFTYLPGNLNAVEVFSTDVGPGNTMMDSFVQENFSDKYYDNNAAIAASGTINEGLLQALKDHSFFQKEFPKTTGPELFNLQYLRTAREKSKTTDISSEDTMATLNRFSADMIVDAVRRTLPPKSDFKMYLSGGGMHNPLLIKNIREQLRGYDFYSTSNLNIHPDAKEAVLFAVLANECVCGGLGKYSQNQHGIPNVSMGKISFPD